MTTVHTVGHSTRTLDEVVSLLRSNGVDMLVDVRAFPSSRKFPQWDRENIQSALPQDIGYEWIPELGGRRHTPAGVQSPNGGWRVKAFRAYADYMATAPFQVGLDRLLRLAFDASPVIMCSEALPWRCHRRLITDALLARGVEVRNIISPQVAELAQLTPFARVDAGRLTYPPGSDSR
jgi:uncharacterized protein (DUF488 family)